MLTDELILYLAVNAFETEIVRRSMLIFFRKPRGRFMCIFSYFLYFVVAAVAHGLENFFTSFLVKAAATGLIVFQYDGGVKKKAAGAGFALALMYLCEFAAAFFFGELLQNGTPNVSALLISKLLNFMIVLIVKRIADHKSKAACSKAYSDRHSECYTEADWSAAALVPISTAVLGMTVIRSAQSAAVTVMAVITILFLDAFIFFLFDKLAENYRQKSELARVEREKAAYIEQCAVAMSSQDELRKFRHDINNRLGMLKIFSDNGDLGAVREFLSEMLPSVGSGDRICYTRNAAVDGILNCKLEKVLECGARVETDLNVPYQMFINTNDLTLIMGNLLDNIAEALAAVRNEKYCLIRIKYSKSRLLIHLKNSYENNISYKDGNLESGKSDGGSHGIGLRSVRDVVDKYNGYMDITHDGKYFDVKIILLLP